MAKSVVDYVFRWLATKFLDLDAQRATGILVDEPEAAARLVTSAPVAAPTADQRDAPSCAFCGQLMVRNGTCYRCLNCGATSGCS